MKTNAHNPLWMWPAGYTDISVNRYPFGLLLGLSLLIHLLALARWPSLQIEEHVELALPVADFAVQLQQSTNRTEPAMPLPAANPATTSVSRPVPIRTRPVNAHEHRQTVIQPEVTAIAAQTETSKIEETVKTVTFQPAFTNRQTAAEEQPLKSSHSHVISRLQHNLKQYFYYPRLARRKNIQGTVILGFAIDLRGTLSNIHIVRSSGFAILDMAAEDALLKLHHLDGQQDWQADNNFIELPVIYKLTEG